MKRTNRSLSMLVAALGLAAALAAALLLAAGSASARGNAPRAHAAASHRYIVGIGDEHAQMFNSPRWTGLHTKIVRYIAPYDAMAHRDDLNNAITFIQAAEAAHQQVLVAFYHSQHSPTRLPSVAQYQHYVQKFVRYFPRVHQYQSWDEANRGNVPGYFSSPSAGAAARYYQALLRVCHHCNVIGLDVLDAYHIWPTLAYISEFKREIGKLHTVMPGTWGLHNYSDINRLESWRTRELVRAMGGQVWLTETGGIVQFGGAFPNRRGAGLARAAKVLKYMFALAGNVPQVKRLYIYNWTGGYASTRFDAGLMNAHNQPRAGWQVVCKALHGSNCYARLARN